MLGVNEQFPEFVMNVVKPNGNEMTSITEEDLEGSWAVIYFYPKDFTFICPTEIAEFDNISAEEARVIGISGDNEFCKVAWKESNAMIGDINHELGADCGLVLANDCGVIDHDEQVALRATFILDPDGVVKYAQANALDTGRNAHEVLRTLQALKAGGLTGCSWNPGEEFVA